MKITKGNSNTKWNCTWDHRNNSVAKKFYIAFFGKRTTPQHILEKQSFLFLQISGSSEKFFPWFGYNFYADQKLRWQIKTVTKVICSFSVAITTVNDLVTWSVCWWMKPDKLRLLNPQVQLQFSCTFIDTNTHINRHINSEKMKTLRRKRTLHADSWRCKMMSLANFLIGHLITIKQPTQPPNSMTKLTLNEPAISIQVGKMFDNKCWVR